MDDSRAPNIAPKPASSDEPPPSSDSHAQTGSTRGASGSLAGETVPGRTAHPTGLAASLPSSSLCFDGSGAGGEAGGEPAPLGSASTPRGDSGVSQECGHSSGTPGRSFSKIFWGLGMLFLYALDQATKAWTVAHLPLGAHLEVAPPWFLWVHFSNTGAAFGILQDSNRFFIGLSLVALLALGGALARGVFPGRLNHAALLLLLAGVLGNLTDRLVHHYVVDFLYFDLGFAPFHPWPAFNVADSCICVAVGLLLWASFREEWQRHRSPPVP